MLYSPLLSQSQSEATGEVSLGQAAFQVDGEGNPRAPESGYFEYNRGGAFPKLGQGPGPRGTQILLPEKEAGKSWKEKDAGSCIAEV